MITQTLRGIRQARNKDDPPDVERQSGLPYRILLTVMLAALLGFALGVDERLRGWEAYIASYVVAVAARTETGFNIVHAVVSFDRETGEAKGLQITPECTAAFLVIPLIVVTALIVWLRRKVSVWPMLALLAAVVLLALTDQARILTVVLLIKGLGFEPGYYWGHTMVGTVISVFGIGCTLVVYTVLAVRRGGSAQVGAVSVP
ncbi:exosortase/archaeosortase family protein [Sinosporangium album]|uniref:Exosortase/archaeosortase family protein n=1 Tax=Sinosporangium album TaxID=504805 RepID=A0A1G8H2K0_9ACTN|nr:hypothetical protein [Sinosporangium album]SDI00826.1 exosortase/archaeosortase family protein [Sinosporangium album]